MLEPQGGEWGVGENTGSQWLCCMHPLSFQSSDILALKLRLDLFTAKMVSIVAQHSTKYVKVSD